MYFSISNILPAAWIAFGIAIAAMVWLLGPYRLRIKLPLPADDSIPENLPAVSVIVYTGYNAAILEANLPRILGQNYPGEFEVIVVNDGSDAEVSDVVKRLSAEYSNIYQTFVPDHTRNLSRKKLAVSLGIKAARHDFVVLTTGDCAPASTEWLSLMARHFADGKEVVIGWARISGLKSAMKAYDQVASADTWLTSALRGKPYRATGMNLGYSRRLFFEAKGFSRSQNLHYGDDDIFVHQIAGAENTAVELSQKARMKCDCANPSKMWHELKLRHAFTDRFLPKGPSLMMGFSTLMMWVWIAAVAVCAVFSLPNLLLSCVLAAMIPALWIPLTMRWRKNGFILGIRLSPVFLWWQMLWRWIPDLRARSKCTKAGRQNYTWLQK